MIDDPHMNGQGLVGENLTLAYDSFEVTRGLDITIPTGEITCIVGPNACGKSTLLKALARLLKPRTGVVLLDGESIHKQPTRQVAMRLGMLPQAPIAPEGILVADLVTRGRYPHQRWLRQQTVEDDRAISNALTVTGTADLAERSVDELSGGQRQRVWIAMALAQDTQVMLLDEPTTYLDLAHQIEILDLLIDLNRNEGRTIVLVLHDINQAARYSHNLIAMKEGAVVAEGPPEALITETLVRDVFGLESRVVSDVVSGTPLVLPIGRHQNRTTPQNTVIEKGSE